MNRRLALTLAALTLIGCASTKNSARPAPMAPSPSPDQLEAIRADYKNAFPKARIGVVSAVDEASGYLLVDQMDKDGLAVGQYVSFLDAEQDVIANGKIAKVDGGVTVQFQAGKRSPQVGDAAVKF